ncbi:uncharacterized protein LOC124809736 isoform X1 [Hydra vulgaris]|uniref:uncharacterized protein LOC124809736 isoform X1 n=1 Tax=Hydra vulgaris TaxID=6087 RepID=UPI001F5F1C2A|nr:uncharacterized protein LOC124809736 [Hydra vulgaris]
MQEDGVFTTLRRSKVKRTLLSPTRKNNPQPIGLIYQSPLYPAAPRFAIWNQERTSRKACKGMPSLISHIGNINFTCSKILEGWQCEMSRQLPILQYSLDSTNRFSYQNPSKYPGFAKALKEQSCRPNDGAASGIVPRICPTKLKTKKHFKKHHENTSGNIFNLL